MSTHPPGFLALVNDARSRIQEVQARDLPGILAADPKARPIDVREESEYAAGHDTITDALARPEFAPRALYDRFNIAVIATTESPLDDLKHHAAIAADNVQKMGYTKVVSVDGGWRVLKDLLPTE